MLKSRQAASVKRYVQKWLRLFNIATKEAVFGKNPFDVVELPNVTPSKKARLTDEKLNKLNQRIGNSSKKNREELCYNELAIDL